MSAQFILTYLVMLDVLLCDGVKMLFVKAPSVSYSRKAIVKVLSVEWKSLYVSI